MYPDDATLLARGKYSTLSSEKRKQIERLQNVCTTITSAAHAVLRDAQASEPEFLPGPVETLDKCLVNLKDARGKIMELVTNMSTVKPMAWPE